MGGAPFGFPLNPSNMETHGTLKHTKHLSGSNEARVQGLAEHLHFLQDLCVTRVSKRTLFGWP